MADLLTADELERALHRASDYGPVESLIRRPESAEQLQEAVQAATIPARFPDQKGRIWSRWQTLIPGHFRLCRRCGCKIQAGYILEPHVTTAICEKHVRLRWV